MSQTWNWGEYQALRDKFPFMGVGVKLDLDKKEEVAIIAKAQRIGTTYSLQFTPEELKLASKYGKRLGPAMIFLCPNRSPAEIEELLKCSQK